MLSHISNRPSVAFLTYQRIRDRVIPMSARCRKNLSNITTHVDNIFGAWLYSFENESWIVVSQDKNSMLNFQRFKSAFNLV